MKNTKQVFIFIGNSGSGKGTQAEFLKKKLKDKKETFLYIYPGSFFRKLHQKSCLVAKFSKTLNQDGKLQPSFLACYAWTDFLIKKYQKHTNLLIDGSPRTKFEAERLIEALEFLDFQKIHIIFLKTKDKDIIERMLKRKRVDDSLKQIKGRLAWFHREFKAIKTFLSKNKKRFNFYEINATQTPKEVFLEICKKLKIK